MSSRHTTINEAVDVDIAIKKVAAYLLDTEEVCMISRYSWHRDDDEEAIDLKNPDTLRDYRGYVAEHASERVDEALAELCWSIDEEEGRVSIWRSLTVPRDFLEDGIHQRPIGVYWSFRKDAAEPHWGNFSDDRREIVLHAVASMEDVDWQTSVQVNAHSEEERELRLKPTAIVHVLSATWSAIPNEEPERIVLLGADFAAGKAAYESFNCQKLMVA